MAVSADAVKTVRQITGAGFIDCIPVFLASKSQWAARFAERNLPVIGDDIEAQLVTTMTHQIISDLFRKRGVQLERTYQ